eukprot:TRINITY_DN1048_c0_g3_i1.p1 TRINITY_DN1048_c0_g3~~TRINITY_DN1048_c0_g3_i1.p1  ORF type:complete len:256 (+),score=42.19 TRINITY_DN1048_c0_g3_i1:53-769(+)
MRSTTEICRVCNGSGSLILVKLPGVRASLVHEHCRLDFEDGYTRKCNICEKRCSADDECETDEIGHLTHTRCHKVNNNVDITGSRLTVKRKSVHFNDERATITDTMDKFSVGRIGTFRNWRSRRFVADKFGIEYFKGSSQCGRVSFTPSTRLRLACTRKHHPQAKDSSSNYMLIHFREIDESRTLLIRTSSPGIYAKWSLFLSQHITTIDDSDDEDVSEFSDTCRSQTFSVCQSSDAL